MPKFYVYMLQCADGSYYVGHTDDLVKRIDQHKNGKIDGYTKKRLPVTLVWSQDYADRYQAIVAELRIKGWNRKKKEALMRGDWGTIVKLSNLDNTALKD
jgi:predicted GIY-YIG superfamily endonuclease